jgi:signal transduction histidine kinase
MVTDMSIEAATEKTRKGMADSGIPVGAVLVHRGRIIGWGHNRRIQRNSVILHAEMDGLKSAGHRSHVDKYRESAVFEKMPRNADSYPPGLARGWPLFLFLASLLLTNPVLANTQDLASELISLVRDAAELVEKEGEAAFPKFRDPGGKWFEDDGYVFVWGLDGKRHVFPPDTTGEGQNMRNLKDINDKPIGQWFIARANSANGAGWVHYQWPRPGEIFPVWKSTYVKRAISPAGNAYLVGSGRYNMPLDRSFIVNLVEKAAGMLNELGKAGFSRLKDDSDEFVFMDTYVFVVALSGVEYVNPAFPNLEGRNLLDYKDAAGNFLVKEMIEKTENAASAWVEYFWPRPGSGEAVKKLAYVRRISVDDEMMIIGAGLYELEK